MTRAPGPTRPSRDALARLYDLDLVEDPGDLDLYLALAARAGGSVLELAAGTGRLAVPLAEAGHAVTAVDIDPAMLARLRRRAAPGRRTPHDARLTIVEARPARPPTAGLPASFALAFIALNSLFLLATRDAQRQAFRTMADHLAPGGLAVVDVWLPDADDLARFDGRLILEYDRDDPETGARVTKVAAAQHDAATGIVNLTAIYEEGRQGEPAARYVRRDVLRLVSAGELEDFATGRRARGRDDRRRLRPGRRSGPAATGRSSSPAGPRPRPPPAAGPPSPPAAVRPGGAGSPFRLATLGPMASSDQTRLLLVEDVPQVAQYIRGLLNSQTSVKLLDVMTDGSKVIPQIQQLRPGRRPRRRAAPGPGQGPPARRADQGRRRQRPGHRPDRAPEPGRAGRGGGHPRRAVDAVLGLRPADAHQHGPARVRDRLDRRRARGSSRSSPRRAASARRRSRSTSRSSIGQQGQRTVLIDGSLQFGDLRALLKVPVDAPSILDLPTDRVAESDLQDVLWRDPSGIDILLAPPRVEMAEMITARDIDKVLSLLRRVYGAIVIDMSSVLNDINLAFLDLSDTIVEIVTYDSTTIHNTVAVADAFRMIGYSPSKVRYLVNRADSAGGIDPADLERAIGRVPEHRVVSDGILVVQSNNEGVPFVLANPAAQISQDIARVAAEILAVHGIGRTGRGQALTDRCRTLARSVSSTPAWAG